VTKQLWDIRTRLVTVDTTKHFITLNVCFLCS